MSNKLVDLFTAKMIDTLFDNPHTDSPLKNFKNKKDVSLVCDEIRKVCQEMFDVYTVREIVDRSFILSQNEKTVRSAASNRLVHNLAKEFVTRENIPIYRSTELPHGGIEFELSVAVLTKGKDSIS